MIETLKSYREYKSADVLWLDQVPAHWDMPRMKHIFSQRNIRGFPHEPILAATQTKGVVRKDEYEYRTVLALKDLHFLKLVEVGDFVISLRSFQGGIEYARHRGIISPAYTILYPNESFMHGYFATLFKSRPFIDGLRLYVTGIRQGQNIDYVRLSRSRLPLPPREELQAISAYVKSIDHRCARFIRNRLRLIEVLNEQKQAIINRAVTRGLDSSAPLEPSGVDWLGDIPKHWEVGKLRSLFKRHGSGTTPSGDQYYGGGVPWVMTGDLTDGFVQRTRRTVTQAAIDEISALRMYPSGSLLVAMYGATIGKTAILQMSACTNQACCVLADPKDESNTQFLQYVVITCRPILIQQSYGGGQPNINSGIVRSLRVPLPPRSEQDQIVGAIEKQTAKLNLAIVRAQREIDLIREYRTRLIADVVTGKVDVRHLAPPLGSEDLEESVDELEPLDYAAGELDEEALAEVVHYAND